MSESPITKALSARRLAGEMSFIPFIAAGDPDLPSTIRLIQTLSTAGADLIEIGFPYSDPIADGPVIQSSYTRALGKHLKLADLFATIEQVSKTISTPLVGMVSFAIIFRTGTRSFLEAAKKAGFAGLIIPDLPGDEATEFAALTKEFGIDLIQLVAPTTPAARMDKILATASGFIYCIAVAGTTGVRDAAAHEIEAGLKLLREKTQLPLCVGFGVSQAAQIEALRGKADGAIVGSAIVRHLDGAETPAGFEKSLTSIQQFAEQLAAAAHHS
ncbi:tryptophan synthase, alpha subunit [Planctopirus limnophila DSM 3776]|uniref:Tryptophan synthase alpha chain n=1 Tax=Planctopirus limnophila (strain ATCC 43296 / DSM 3776 / IFAM 1008 / Mu 290) TaxID=521674 RepID=D5STH5_PLAL2|nr:tryptophan synthase subunit alpha [Planctopirus limnophila]ADG69004.1 tryptophan synthase, alpha subunit [Planctopirus limnophila DSM 3776]